MKRSEMIEKLMWYLPIESGLCNQEDVEGILDFLEGQGMLPPFDANIFYKNWVSSKDTNCSGYKWAPEDLKDIEDE